MAEKTAQPGQKKNSKGMFAKQTITTLKWTNKQIFRPFTVGSRYGSTQRTRKVTAFNTDFLDYIIYSRNTRKEARKYRFQGWKSLQKENSRKIHAPCRVWAVSGAFTAKMCTTEGQFVAWNIPCPIKSQRAGLQLFSWARDQPAKLENFHCSN